MMNTKELTVLVVEDDENDAFFIQRAFQANGVTRPPHLCRDVPDAMRYVQGCSPYENRSRYPYPTFIITDLKMPGTNGLEFLKWLFEHPELRVTPTCVLSSSALPSDVNAAYCFGANCFMQKPVGLAEYTRVIGGLLQHWRDCEVPTMVGISCPEAMVTAQSGPFGGRL